ncbi:hypothetical protein HY00_00020 [Peptococcaceae bacterium SCADC1_2_3]|jgi:MerR family transcriptional regulator/heat shock protein HspR|nr:hypothetical protein HY00_00020 [Peptococcaceae bacterium SCADC1_2_3]
MFNKKNYPQIYRYSLTLDKEANWLNINACNEIHPELIQILADLGVIEIHQGYIKKDELSRLYKILRLRECLGLNYAGCAVVLDLLDRIEDLRAEIERLKRLIK